MNSWEPEGQRRFLASADTLAALIEKEWGGPSPGSGGLGPSAEALQYTSRLLAHLIASSGNVSRPEIGLLRQYHLDSYTEVDEMEYVKDVVARSRAFLQDVPGFLKETAGTPTATTMVECIRGMCHGIVAVDDVEEPGEVTAVQQYLAFFEEAAKGG
jgi:hypothetical protein